MLASILTTQSNRQNIQSSPGASTLAKLDERTESSGGRNARSKVEMKWSEMVEKKVQRIQMGFENRVKEMKPYIFNLASTFIKDQARAVTQLLTRQHHLIVKQFISYRERSAA